MADVMTVTFDRDEERRLLAEWLATVTFDVGSPGVPSLEPEPNDEDDRDYDDDALVARFDPDQPRDFHGRWADVPGGIPDVRISSGRGVTPAVIYKKHAHGAVVGVSPGGDRRLRWAADRKKFIAEERRDGDWVETAELTKTAAYADTKTPGKWHEPVETGTTDRQPPSPEPPEPAPAVVEPTVKTDPLEGQAALEAVSHRFTYDDVTDSWTHNVSDVPVTTIEALDSYAGPQHKRINGDLRHRFGDVGKLNKAERRAVENLDRTIAQSAVERDVVTLRGVKNGPHVFGDAWDRDMTGLEWTEHGYVSTSANRSVAERFSRAGDAGNALLHVRVPGGTHAIGLSEFDDEAEVLLERGLRMRVVRDRGVIDGRRQLDVEVIPSDDERGPRRATPGEGGRKPQGGVGPTGDGLPGRGDTPGTGRETVGETRDVGYEGPRFELPEDVDQATVDEFTDLMRRSVLDGLIANAPSLTSGEERRLYDLRDRLLTQNRNGVVVRRLSQEAQVAAALERWQWDNGLPADSSPKYKRQLAERVRAAFAGKKIAVRVTPKNLENVLDDGRFKSQFESNRSRGNNDAFQRARVEQTWFGIAADRHEAQAVLFEPERRPVYGYVMVDGVRPAGVGSADPFDPTTDALSQYGQIQVVLKDRVRSRTTAMFGDSLNNQHQGLPSPVNQPTWHSFTPAWQSMVTAGLAGADRDVTSREFRSGNYAEAEVHGGVTVDDIDEVLLPSGPPAALRDKLDRAGVRWRVLNLKTAADSTPEERANALRVAEQDESYLRSEIVALEERLADYESRGDEYTAKQTRTDLRKLRAQLKKVTDALPALRGGRT